MVALSAGVCASAGSFWGWGEATVSAFKGRRGVFCCVSHSSRSYLLCGERTLLTRLQTVFRLIFRLLFFGFGFCSCVTLQLLLFLAVSDREVGPFQLPLKRFSCWIADEDLCRAGCRQAVLAAFPAQGLAADKLFLCRALSSLALGAMARSWARPGMCPPLTHLCHSVRKTLTDHLGVQILSYCKAFF